MTVRLAIVLSLVGSLLASPANAAEPAPVECPRTFELVTPADWRCEEEGVRQCTVCRNRSVHYTDLIVRCTRDDTHQRVPMPPGGQMAICGGSVM